MNRHDPRILLSSSVRGSVRGSGSWSGNICGNRVMRRSRCTGTAHRTTSKTGCGAVFILGPKKKKLTHQTYFHLYISLFIKYIFLIYRSHDDQTRPRQRRGRGGTGSQSRDSSHFQDSPSPHSSNHTSPSAAPAPAPLAPAAASAPVPPGPPGVMRVAELVQQPGRDHLPYLTPYPHGRGQT